MLESGYTKKLIEQFKAALAEVNDLRTSNKMADALEVIQNAFSSIFRLNSMFFDSVSLSNLIDILKVNGIIEKDKAIIISKLLEEEADLYEKLGKENESFHIYIKSMSLFIEAYFCDREAELTDYLNDIDIIFSRVSDYKLPNDVLIKLVCYFEDKKMYSSSEDMLYEYLENCNYDNDAVNFSINFYGRLLKKNDDELECGNLPRSEIEESLKNLERSLLN